MAKENVSLVDRDYDQCVEVNPSRQIRTRALSFENIRAKFLKLRLDAKVMRTLATPYYSFNYEKKIDKRTKDIAKLEEKIMFLSREEVPHNYVERRAIKLRKNMINNLTFHAMSIYGSGYMVGLENKDLVMAPGLAPDESLQSAAPAVGEPVAVTTEPVPATTEPVAVTTDPIPAATEPVAVTTEPVANDEAGSIPFAPVTLPEESLPNALAEATSTDPIDVTGQPLDRDALADVINAEFSAINPDATAETPTGDGEATEESEEPVIDKNVFKAAVDDAIAQLGGNALAPANGSVPTKTETVATEPDQSKVIKSSEASVRPERFDENGERVSRPKRYSYTPMTDEEIRAAQINIGMDENGNYVEEQKPVVSSGREVGKYKLPPMSFDKMFPSGLLLLAGKNPEREVPVIPKDRDDEGLDLSEGTSMFEIVSPPTEDDAKTGAATPTSSSMTSDDYLALKEKVMELRKRRADSKRRREEAQKRVEKATADEESATASFEKTQADYQARIGQLHSYIGALENELKQTQEEATAVEEEARRREEAANAKRREADKTRQMISDLAQMMGDALEEDVKTTAFGK